MRNAKFRTNLQSLSIPFTNEEKHMFTLLERQNFTLNIEFINTAIKCNVVSIEFLLGLTWSVGRWLNCNNRNSILSLSIALPFQQISVRLFLEDTVGICALRMGLSGPGDENSHYVLRDLHFYESFAKKEHILSQTLPIQLDLTKVINETHVMEGEHGEFSGIFIPTFAVDMNSLFVSTDQFVRSALPMTTRNYLS